MNLATVRFTGSFPSLASLPPPDLPEIAFAGRSNVGKSSLINRLTGRRGLVKTSSRPGKTRALNFFLVPETCVLVDLPGYGFARVSRRERRAWDRLLTGYLLERPTLACVVVIIDLRHGLKELDRNLVAWLDANTIPRLVVYTKADKLGRGAASKNARSLDAALGLDADQRVIFSARSGLGRQELEDALAKFVKGR